MTGTMGGTALGAVVVDGSASAQGAVTWGAAGAFREGRGQYLVHATDNEGHALFFFQDARSPVLSEPNASTLMVVGRGASEPAESSGVLAAVPDEATADARPDGIQPTRGRVISGNGAEKTGRDILFHDERRSLSECTAGWSCKYPHLLRIHEMLLGFPVQVLAVAAEYALAVVVGRRGKGGYGGMRVGSVVHGLLHRAHRPVISAPVV